MFDAAFEVFQHQETFATQCLPVVQKVETTLFNWLGMRLFILLCPHISKIIGQRFTICHSIAPFKATGPEASIRGSWGETALGSTWTSVAGSEDVEMQLSLLEVVESKG